jgi:hypothetical protein
MSQKHVAIVGHNNTKAQVTGQNELLVKVNNIPPATMVAAGVAKTTTIARPTNSGTVAAGASAVSIANVGTASGTVKTITLKAGETVNFDGGAVNNTLDAITYDATGTEFLIITIL